MRKYHLPSSICFHIVFGLLFSLSVICVASCGSSAAQDEDSDDISERPQWVQSRPVSGSDYIGIGIVSKKKNPYDYASRAKNHALNEIASEISSNVSSRSVLNTLEAGDNFFENYQSDTKVKSNIWLEGYTQVDAYENNNTYWVYYKLGKAVYKETKARKVKETLSKSKDLYRQAEQFESQDDYRSALVYLFKALDVIQPFWTEVLETELKGKKVFYGNVLINKIFQVTQAISITAKHPTLKVNRGFSLSKDQISFVVTGAGQRPLNNLPMRINTPASHLIKNKRLDTDSKGKLSFEIAKVSGDKATVYLDVLLDMGLLIREAGGSFLIEQMMAKVTIPKSTVAIRVLEPLLVIRSTEKKIKRKKQTEDFLAAYMTQKGLRVKKDNLKRKDYKAAFTIEIDAGDYQVKEVQPGIFHATYRTDLRVSKKKELVGDYDIRTLEGKGTSKEKAINSLIKKIESEVKYRLGNKIYRTLF